MSAEQLRALFDPWWSMPDRMEPFLIWLHDQGLVSSVTDVISVVGEPWHWQFEYDQFCREQAAEDPEGDRAA